MEVDCSISTNRRNKNDKHTDFGQHHHHHYQQLQLQQHFQQQLKPKEHDNIFSGKEDRRQYQEAKSQRNRTTSRISNIGVKILR